MYKLTLVLFLFFSFQNTAMAYLGPGMGGGIIAATIGFIIALFTLLFAILWFPIKRLFKKKNKNLENKKKN